MDGVVKEMRTKLSGEHNQWTLRAINGTDDTVQLTDSLEILDEIMDEFNKKAQ